MHKIGLTYWRKLLIEEVFFKAYEYITKDISASLVLLKLYINVVSKPKKNILHYILSLYYYSIASIYFCRKKMIFK